MTLIRILVGILLLTLGYQMFWLFVGGVGFVTAIRVTDLWTLTMPTWATLLIALFVGILGAVLAIIAQEFAVGLAGFLAGGAVALGFASMLGVQVGLPMPAIGWILMSIGAVAGLILAILLFDWAVLILSSLSGAILIAQSLQLSPPLTLLVTGVLCVVGFIIQLSWMQKQSPRNKSTYR